MLPRITGLLAAAMLCAAGAQAQEPSRIFDPGALKGPARGKPNEVLVLGTPHLAGLKDPFKPAGLALVNGRLAAWKPQIIAIEALSGMQCDQARRFKARHPDARKVVPDSWKKFAEFVQTAPKPVEERFYNVRIDTNGAVASVWFDFDFLVDGKVTNRGSESWQMVRAEDGWKISSMLFSMGR